MSFLCRHCHLSTFEHSLLLPDQPWCAKVQRSDLSLNPEIQSERCPIIIPLLPPYHVHKPWCKGEPWNKWAVAAVIASPPVHAFMCTVRMRRPWWGCAVLIFAVIFGRCRFRGFHPAACSLCSSCSQIDQVAVTCNESLALSIMSALLDKSLHFLHICTIATNRQWGRENKSKREGGEKKKESLRLLTSASSLEQPSRQTARVPLAFLLAHWERSGLFTGLTTITLLYQSLLYAACDRWREEKWPLGFLRKSGRMWILKTESKREGSKHSVSSAGTEVQMS